MKVNILVINPDQMRADAMHHMGCEAAYTPNIDKLLEDGVSFSNAFCQNPVCGYRPVINEHLDGTHTGF